MSSETSDICSSASQASLQKRIKKKKLKSAVELPSAALTEVFNSNDMHHQQQQQQLRQQNRPQSHQQQQQQQQQQPQSQMHNLSQSVDQSIRKLNQYNMSGSDTDISTSNENLSVEQRYVLRHTPRVEPQGQENLFENLASGNESAGAIRYSANNRSHSGSQTPVFNSQQNANNSNGNNGINSNRNSLKENIHSNRSSMDVSTSSYNTLIIHPDETLHSQLSRFNMEQQHQLMQDTSSGGGTGKKERPYSFGEQGLQEITEIPDEYLNQSLVLKHLCKEMRLPSKRQNSASSRECSELNTSAEREPPKYEQYMMTVAEQNEQSKNKTKSKSQPDLTKLPENEDDAVESLVKENALLKQQLENCFLKVAKTQKLEEEVTNIYRVHEELKQTCERREKLERAARMRLQSDLQRVQELNSVMKDQVDILQSQLLAPSEHQILIAQLFTQNKELSAAKERQDIELSAQRATLQEQRNHIGILDSALTNAQQNIRRLEEELRKKQIYIDRLNQMHGALQQSKQIERKNMLEFDADLAKDSNRSGSSTNSAHLYDKGPIIRLESEQRHMDDAMRQNAKLSTIDKGQQNDRILAEAQQVKLRYLEEVHNAQRKVNDLQSHLKLLESKLADKDAEIRLLQEKKICGSSYDSYNSYAMSPLSFNSPGPYNQANNAFNAAANAQSILEQAFSHPSSSIASSYVPNANFSAQPSSSPYKQTAVANLQAMNLNSGVNATGAGSIGSAGGNYSANSSNYSNNYDSPNYTQNTSSYDTSYENIARKSIDDQLMKKHIDEQLLTKRGLCCFPSLSSKKSNMALLSDQVSVLSTNNSDSFLQKLTSIEQRDRDKHEQRDQDQGASSNGTPMSMPLPNQTKADDIVFLEKQGLFSQKLRINLTGNLAQVTHTVGQNMTDISNIGNSNVTKNPKMYGNIGQTSSAFRGTSLPPSALPRPPRSLKPPRKIEYDRLSDSLKARSQTPPSAQQPLFEVKAATLKRNEFPRRAGKSYEMKEILNFPNSHFSLKRKDYGTIQNKSETEFSKPEHTSTKYYQRLEDSPKMNKSANESSGFKRSLLPSVRKYSPATVEPAKQNQQRDSMNSSESNHSISSHVPQNLTQLKLGVANSSPYHQYTNSRTPPKMSQQHEKTFLQSRQQQLPSSSPAKSSGPMLSNGNQQNNESQTTSLPPKPTVHDLAKRLPPRTVRPLDQETERNSGRRGNSVSRGENRYKIQF